MTPSQHCARSCSGRSVASDTTPAPALCPSAASLAPRGEYQTVTHPSCAPDAHPSALVVGTDRWTRTCSQENRTQTCSISCAP